MALTPLEADALRALQDNDSSRGLTSGEVGNIANLLDAEYLLENLVELGLAEKRNQTDKFWPSGRAAEAIPLVGGQIRSRARYRAVQQPSRARTDVRAMAEEYYSGVDNQSVR